MLEKEAIYRKYLEKLRLKLIAKYDELGLRASSKYERELEEEVKGDKLIMWGAFHAQFMENGRESGKFPPRKAIEDWIETKSGLPSEFKERKSQFAFLIARKIAKEGVKVPNHYNKGQVVSSVVNDFLANDIAEMLQELGDIYMAQMIVDVKQIFAQAA